jgi:hypothetical protein
MLDEFGDTFEQISEDSDEKINPRGREIFMTSSQKRAVNFDKFKENIAAKYKVQSSPGSCDALYMHSGNEWFLIEFKNGNIDKEKVFQIRGKIFQSLLLLTEKLDKTIGFTRVNLSFILVYNENTQKADTSRISVGKSLYALTNNSNFVPFGLEGLQKLYFKEVCVWDKKEFESNFVKKYCTP